MCSFQTTLAEQHSNGTINAAPCTCQGTCNVRVTLAVAQDTLDRGNLCGGGKRELERRAGLDDNQPACASVYLGRVSTCWSSGACGAAIVGARGRSHSSHSSHSIILTPAASSIALAILILVTISLELIHVNVELHLCPSCPAHGHSSTAVCRGSLEAPRLACHVLACQVAVVLRTQPVVLRRRGGTASR